MPLHVLLTCGKRHTIDTHPPTSPHVCTQCAVSHPSLEKSHVSIQLQLALKVSTDRAPRATSTGHWTWSLPPSSTGTFGSILSPSLTIPCRRGSSITRGEAALNLLSCLCTLAKGKTLDEDLLVARTEKSPRNKPSLTFKEVKRFPGSEKTCIALVVVM